MIVEHKLQKQTARGIACPKCNTIRFGEVMGHRKAFLIQNMFPVTSRYILNTYVDPNTHKPVTVPPETTHDIYVNARDVLKLILRGHAQLVFPDICQLYSTHAEELEHDRFRNSSDSSCTDTC